MRIKTPLGLFTTIVGVGLVPAFGLGCLIGVSMKDYDPIPSESSIGVTADIGNRTTPNVIPTPTPRPTTMSTPTGKGRVEFEEPEERTPNLVKPTTVKVIKTPHAEGSEPNEPAEESPDPVPTTPAPTLPAPEHEQPPAPKDTGEPVKPAVGPEDSDLRPAPKNS